jgi:hypothetical protein
MNNLTGSTFGEYRHGQSLIAEQVREHISASLSSRFFADLARIQRRIRHESSGNALQVEQVSNPSIEGTIFIKDNILSDITKETLMLFDILDPSVYMFMLTKAVYIFTLGPKGNNQIPDFFYLKTKERIEKQRKEFIADPPTEYIANELQKMMKDFGVFEGVKEKDVEGILGNLKNLVHEEIYGGMLTKCLSDALYTQSR